MFKKTSVAPTGLEPVQLRSKRSALPLGHGAIFRVVGGGFEPP